MQARGAVLENFTELGEAAGFVPALVEVGHPAGSSLAGGGLGGGSLQAANCENVFSDIGVMGHSKEISIQSRGIAEKKPQLGIVGRSLCRALRHFERLRVVALLQRLLCGSRQARVLNVRAPPERRLLILRLIGLCLRTCRVIGAHLIRLSAYRACDRSGRQRK